MVGAGIFSLLGAAGEVAGSAVWISFLLAGTVAVLQGYSFSKIGARYPSSGGLLEYVVRGYGNGHMTGVIAWLVLAVNAIITAMVAVSFGSYAAAAIGAEDSAFATKAFAALLVVAMSVLNAFGSQAVARVQSVVVVVVIGILSVFAVATLANADFALLAPSGYPPLGDIVGERRADVLRVPRLRRDHVHRGAARRPAAPAAAGGLPGARDRDRHLRCGCPRRVRDADRRRGHRLGRHGARRRRGAGARAGRATGS